MSEKELLDTAKKPVTKKGKTTWKPANIMGLTNKDPNYSYKWAEATGQNIQRYIAEGWEVVDRTTDKVNALSSNTMDFGSQQDTTIRSREMILIRTPRENAEARKEYYANEMNETIKAIKTNAETGLNSAGAVKPYGKFTIS